MAVSYYDRTTWHKDLTDEQILAAVESQHTALENPGFCIVCGFEAEGCEPDAMKYKCESCGEKQVYGAEQLLLIIA